MFYFGVKILLIQFKLSPCNKILLRLLNSNVQDSYQMHEVFTIDYFILETLIIDFIIKIDSSV